MDERNVLNADDSGVFNWTEDSRLLIAGLGELDGVLDNLFDIGLTSVRGLCVVFLIGRRDAIPRQIRFAARTMMFGRGGLAVASGEARIVRSS